MFTARRRDADPEYEAMGGKMFALATRQPGFPGIVAAHVVAQKLGKERWHTHYEVRVARVERA